MSSPDHLCNLHVVAVTRQQGWGGGEVLLLDLLRALAAMGAEVTLIAPRGSELERRANRSVAVSDRVPEDRCDLLICNDFHSLRVAGWRAHGKRVLIVHGSWQTSRLRNVVSRVLDTTLVAVSEVVKAAVLHNGLYRPEQVTVLPLGPNPALFRPPSSEEREQARDHFRISADDVVFAFVGRYQRIKRPLLFVRAVDAVGGPAIGLLATSATFKTKEEVRVQRQVREAVLHSDRVFLIEDGTPLRVLWAADAFISTSQSESLGVAMLEALATGLPVLSMACGGPADFLNDGHNGFTIRSDDFTGLVRRIRSLANDPELRRTLQRNARQSVSGRSPAAAARALLAAT